MHKIITPKMIKDVSEDRNREHETEYAQFDNEITLNVKEFIK